MAAWSILNQHFKASAVPGIAIPITSLLICTKSKHSLAYLKSSLADYI